QLREGGKISAGCFGLVERGEDRGGVAVEVADDRVQLTGGNAQPGHDTPAYRRASARLAGNAAGDTCPRSGTLGRSGPGERRDRPLDGGARGPRRPADC